MRPEDLPLAWIEGRPRRPEAPRAVQARYEGALSHLDNKAQWKYVDALSARAANDPQTRQQLRNRARYERDNNGYLDGLVTTLADDLVGPTGPRLVPRLKDDGANRAVWEAWDAWCRAVRLRESLHVGKMAKTVDGEAFWLLTTDDRAATPVTLYPLALEAEQVQTPAGAIPVEGASPGYWVDGVELDGVGRPAYWHVLNYHPGDTFWPGAFGYGDYSREPARNVLHWFRRRRPRQVRGVPEVTATLPLWAEMRRWMQATLAAAETAADFAAVLTTDQPPADDDSGISDNITPFSTEQIDKRMMVALPFGYKMQQFMATQPTSTYAEFKDELLKEAGRPLGMPRNLITGDSSRYNYSSGRLDHLGYRKGLTVERAGGEEQALDRLLAAWLAEARLVRDYLPRGLPDPFPHVWYWPPFEVIDPETEAKADTLRLLNGTTTLSELMAEYGQDWEEFIRQRGKELALMAKLGVPPPTTTVREQVNQPGQAPAPAPGQPGGNGRNGLAKNGTGGTN